MLPLKQSQRRPVVYWLVAFFLLPLGLILALYIGGPQHKGVPVVDAHGNTRSLARLPSPIPGELVSLPDAKSRVDYPIPILPAAQLQDACNSGATLQLEMQHVFSTSVAASRGTRQVGVTYNGGVWMSLSPKLYFANSVDKSGSELKSVVTAFNASDFPAGLTTGHVRGHVAWLREPDAGSPCFSDSSSTVDPSSSSAPTFPSPQYDSSKMAHLMWLENGTVIDLVGPYSVDQLQSVAAGMSAS
jgi:hypothetical protein